MLARLTALLCSALLVACSGSPSETPSKAKGELKALAEPTALEILALHPHPWELDRDEIEMERFHEYGILGRAELTDDAKRKELMALIERGIEESTGMVAACFNPRHGIIATTAEGVWEFVICFECLSMKVYLDGEQTDGHLTTETYEPQVSALFREAGLTIHKNP